MSDLSEAADRLCERAKYLQSYAQGKDPFVIDRVAAMVTVLQEVALALDPLAIVRCEEQDEPHRWAS